jgi:hypothetical protein
MIGTGITDRICYNPSNPGLCECVNNAYHIRPLEYQLSSGLRPSFRPGAKIICEDDLSAAWQRGRFPLGMERN